MGEYRPFDMTAYAQQVQGWALLICQHTRGRDETHSGYLLDDVGIAFLSKFPTSYGYSTGAPVSHREQVTGEFLSNEYVALQKLVYRVGEPVGEIVFLSLGSQQGGNRHVHWHYSAVATWSALLRSSD